MVSPSSRKALGFVTASDADLKALSEQKRQILIALRDRWATSRDLQNLTGASEASRRVRELRQNGFEIIKRGTGRAIEYHWTGKRSS